MRSYKSAMKNEQSMEEFCQRVLPWFARSVTCIILDTPVRIAPLEEMIWQKAYIMERERFDGADTDL
jgi:hypothetical protein